MVVMRRLLARRVAAMMLRVSPSAVGSQVFASPDEVGAAAPLRLGRVDASAAPRAAADITTSPSARFAFRLWWFADALGALVILVAGGEGLALGWLLLLPLRHAHHVRLVRQRTISAFRRPGFFRRWVTVLSEPLAAMFFQPRSAWFPLPMLAGPNRRLLILRVFGRDENADLAFGALRRAWQHLGASFTVVDSVLRRPRAWSLGFRDLDMDCFDNTWRSPSARSAGLRAAA